MGIAETGPELRRWLYGCWEFYQEYTRTAIHAAAAAALTIFGLLVFIDPVFAGVAIAAYVCPPLVLYALNADVGSEREHDASTGRPGSGGRSETDATASRGLTPRGSDGDLGDTDSDSDSDARRTDTDSDSDSDNRKLTPRERLRRT